jgi:hypothetical protein
MTPVLAGCGTRPPPAAGSPAAELVAEPHPATSPPSSPPSTVTASTRVSPASSPAAAASDTAGVAINRPSTMASITSAWTLRVRSRS